MGESSAVADGAPTARELQALLIESEDLEALGRALASFNILRVLRFEHGELRHSNILAWLLTPDESHGFGDRFLRRWLSRVLYDSGREGEVGVVDLLTQSFRAVTVHREWGRLDLLVHVVIDDDHEWVFAIENKVRATQSDGQLAKYAHWLRSAFPEARRVLLFLTLQEETADDPAWIETSYTLVRDVLQSCREERRAAMGVEPGVLVDHYLQTLRGMTMPNEELAKLAQKIYQQHRRALDYIYEQIEDPTSLTTGRVESLMREAETSAAITPLCCSKGFVRFIPKAWDTPANRAGKAWGQGQSAYLLCEITLGSSPRLKIVEGRSPDAWRTQLFQIATKNKGTLRAGGKMPKQWMSVYSVPIPVPEGTDPEEAGEKIWEFVQKHVGSDTTFQKALGLLSKHLETLPSPPE